MSMIRFFFDPTIQNTIDYEIKFTLVQMFICVAKIVFTPHTAPNFGTKYADERFYVFQIFELFLDKSC